VLARDERSRPIWRRVAQRSARPVVLVPAAARGRRPEIRRVLLPLDGTAESAAAVAGAVEQFAGAGVDLVVLHVFDAETVPRFWDQAAHAGRAWAEEFLARYCAQPGVRLELRTGVAGEHVLDVAEAERADMIAFGWSQQLDPGRARTIRRAVLDAVVPVMLVPIAPG
jgi:nucleotide-binding universal stress UspA family protein